MSRRNQSHSAVMPSTDDLCFEPSRMQAASIRAMLPLHRFKFDVTTHHLPQLNDGLPWHTDGPYNGRGRSL